MSGETGMPGTADVIPFPEASGFSKFEVVMRVDRGVYARDITLTVDRAEIGTDVKVGDRAPFNYLGLRFTGTVISIRPIREGA